jgi:sugar phosphate permease
MGMMSLIFGGVAAWWLIHEPPKSGAPEAAPPSTIEVPPTSRVSPVSMASFLKDRLWWNLAIWNMLFGLAAGGTLVHFAALMQDRGLTLTQAASAISLVGLGGFIGNLAAGWLIDHTSAKKLACQCFWHGVISAQKLSAAPRRRSRWPRSSAAELPHG